jgi:hypothetical protein
MATIKDGWVYVTHNEAADAFKVKIKGDYYLSGYTGWTEFTSDYKHPNHKKYEAGHPDDGVERYRRPIHLCTQEQLALLTGAPTLSDHFI